MFQMLHSGSGRPIDPAVCPWRMVRMISPLLMNPDVGNVPGQSLFVEHGQTNERIYLRGVVKYTRTANEVHTDQRGNERDERHQFEHQRYCHWLVAEELPSLRCPLHRHSPQRMKLLLADRLYICSPGFSIVNPTKRSLTSSVFGMKGNKPVQGCPGGVCQGRQPMHRSPSTSA
jgi:hypothetical protein